MDVSILISLLMLLKVGAAQNGIDATNQPTLTIEDGIIRGITAKTVGRGKSYHAFRGIPYAKPPVGNLRFELIEKNLAVMLFVHGGAFIVGNSTYETSGPDYFLDENIIFVQFNYRLGPFGFLSTEDLVCPGNNGLKDQLLAMKWVRSNIGYFGGNPNNVALFGGSAGAASVSYHLHSKRSQGLFNTAIMNSGSSLCLWSLNRNPKNIAFGIGDLLQVNTRNSETLIKALKNISYFSLQDAAMRVTTKVVTENPLAGLPFSPSREPYHGDAFFYKKSEQALSLGEFHRVPVLMGVTSMEALSGEIPALLRVVLPRLEQNTTILAPADLTNDFKNKQKAARKIRQHYFGLQPISTQKESLFKFLSDDQFNRPCRKTAIEQSKYVPVYFYELSYEGGLGGILNRTSSGVSHGEQAGYFFSQKDEKPSSEHDFIVRYRLLKLWTNFAKYGNPTPTKDPLLQNITWWQSGLMPKNFIYLDIGFDLAIELNPFNKDMKFYDEIYSQYGSPPYDTY